MIVQLDGAKYYTSTSTLELLEKLNIPTIISGPYSFDASPIELFFAFLKRGNLNP